ncbi:MAG: hypothetical protein COT26_03360 [Candidatus Kerfeldbacteria bacterium CG08_land_8_20_14_0_20_43_14]|uniref:Uncharacterized protein n=1 Tax=Candidatus Kerfeldbacteria bacterium CG08_land_8_20_14_0_20_43_14 TaxID=2014246 RepID=A0A2H0YRR8_9BACT|nr:MAG: hypothetical protein COT26_03360 [Candidatus Kerfeldbacteria bacterium CG08_land_8_20_14_0_20_43_14]
MILKDGVSLADIEAASSALLKEGSVPCYMKLSETTRKAVEKVMHVGIGSIDFEADGVGELGIFLLEQLDRLESPAI